jgi:hypothetical protein
MPIELKIKQIVFPELPKTSLGINRVIREFSSKQQDYLEYIATDLSNIIKHGIGSDIIQNPELEILNPLRTFFNAIQSLPRSDIKETLQQQFRYIALSIQLRLNQIADQNFKIQFESFLKDVSGTIGTVSLLNDTVPVPATDFLPPDFENSKIKWKDIIIESPDRDSIRFFTIKQEVEQKEIKIASVRMHLISLDSNATNPNEALSYADADIYSVGDLQADHLQPSEQIIERQLEMLEAMNIDPEFAKEVQKHSESTAFFKKKEDGMFYGTKYFYMLYHNCINNLWLISTSANTGTGKGNQDPIIWLKKHERFGEPFFSAIGGQASINKSTILYLTQGGEMLAVAARKWFLNTYRNEITAAHYVREEILKPLKGNLQTLAQLPQEESEQAERKKRKKIIKTMAKMVMAKILIAESSSESPTHSDTSPNKSSSPEGYAEINPENLDLMEETGTSLVAPFKKSVQEKMVLDYKKTQKTLLSDKKLASDTSGATSQTISVNTATSATNVLIAAQEEKKEIVEIDDNKLSSLSFSKRKREE